MRRIDFGEKKTTKKEFYSNYDKKINDINEILISKGLIHKIINLNEYIIGYKHNQNIKPLYIRFPEYVCRGNTFKKNITISSEINDAYQYNKIWKKIEELMGMNFERKPPFCNNIEYIKKNNTFILFRRLSGHKNSPKRNFITLIYCYFTFCKQQ